MSEAKQSTPVPPELIHEFMGFMYGASDDSLSDGAWLQMLDDAALEFMSMHSLSGDASDAVNQYLEMNIKRKQSE